MMSPRTEGNVKIDEALVEGGLVDARHAGDALKKQEATGEKILDILIENGSLDIGAFARFLAEGHEIPGLNLGHYEIDRETAALIPKDFAQAHEVVALDRQEGQLTVAMAAPLDEATLKRLEEVAGLRVRPFLVARSDLYYMLHRCYGPGAAVTPARPDSVLSAEALTVSVRSRHLVNIIRKIDILPPLPRTVQHCQMALMNPEVSQAEIVKTIEMDPPVAADILRVVNSAAFGLSRRVSGIAGAVAYLGMRETYMVALAATVSGLVKIPEAFDPHGFRAMSLLCATACKSLAEVAGRRDLTVYFTAGLLRELGRYVLYAVAPDRHGKIDAALRGKDLIAAEEETLGIAYPEAGYLLAQKWELPPELCEAIRFHHAPSNAKQCEDVVDVVALASGLLDTVFSSGESLDKFATRNAALLAKLNLNSASLQEALDASVSGVNESITSLDEGGRPLAAAAPKAEPAAPATPQMHEHWVDRLDATGMSPLDRAMMSGNTAVINLLFILQATPDDPTSDDMFAQARRADVRSVREHLDAGAYVDEKDEYGLSLLHYAALNGNLDLAKLCINRGATVTSSPFGLCNETPSALARIMDYEVVLDLLAMFDTVR